MAATKESLQEKLDDDLWEWLESCKNMVRYGDVLSYWDEVTDGPMIPVPRFQQCRNLAVLDLFYSATKPQMAEYIEVSENTVYRILEHPQYQIIRDLVKERSLALASQGGMMNAARLLEPAITERNIFRALTGKGRDGQAAGMQFTDRLSAKKGREDTMVVHMPKDLEETIERAIGTHKRLQLGEGVVEVEYEEIDASVIPMPKNE